MLISHIHDVKTFISILTQSLIDIETTLKFKVDRHDGVIFDMESIPETQDEFKAEFEKVMKAIVEKGAR